MVVVVGRLRGQGWGRVVRMLVPLAALLIDGWAAAIGCVLVQEAGLWLASRLTDACHRTWATRLFLAAYALRAVVAVPTHVIARVDTGNGAMFQDDYTNDLVAEWLVRIARGEGLSVFPGHQHVLDGVYPYMLMALYAVFGHTPLLPKLLNMVLASLSAVLVFDIARRAFRPSTAIIAAIGAIALPSLVVWSVVAVKESLVVLVALIGLWCLQRLIEPTGRLSHVDVLLILLAAVAAALDLRATLALILVGLLLVVLVACAHPPKRLWRIVATGAALFVLVGGSLWVSRGVISGRPPMGVLEDVMLQIRHRRAQEAASARSQIRPEIDSVSPAGSTLPAAEAASDATPFSFGGDVLEPLGYALLAPAPWDARSRLELAASGEMLIWYVLIGASLLAWRARPAQPLFVTCLVLYGVANWLVLAATEGNLGNLVRHRVMLAPALLILGGAGLDWLSVRFRWPGAIGAGGAVTAGARGKP